MKQEKIGAFIAKCRKEKKLTQEELGRRLGVSCQTISKWERGINLPDIFMLPKLSKSLEIDVDELLKSKKIIGSVNKLDVLEDKQEDLSIGILNSHKKISKRKNLKSIKYLLMFLLIIIVFSLLMYFFSNYGRVNIYSISSTSDKFLFSGKLIFNPNGNLMMVNNFGYGDSSAGTIDEKKVKGLKILILNGDNLIINYEKLLDENEELKTLNQLLSRVSIETSLEDINRDDLTDIRMVVSFIKGNDEVEETECDVKLEKEFENNKFFYN